MTKRSSKVPNSKAGLCRLSKGKKNIPSNRECLLLVFLTLHLVSWWQGLRRDKSVKKYRPTLPKTTSSAKRCSVVPVVVNSINQYMKDIAENAGWLGGSAKNIKNNSTHKTLVK